MKKLVRISLLVVAMISLQMTDAVAQKFGYVNSKAILSELPAVKQMEANLKALGTQLQKKGEQMVNAYKQKEESAIAQKERGDLSPVQEENLLKELQTEQQSIMTFEREMQQTIYNKEQELTKPILEQMNTAIQEVAKENGFTMIFEAGVLLFADDAANVSEQVKAKLGI